MSRIDGYKIIWEPLKRVPEQTSETPFTDIDRNHSDFLLMTFAKARGVVNDDARFYPEEPLRLNDALLWLFRSRNVDDYYSIGYDSLRTYAQKYALLQDSTAEIDANRELSREDLSTIVSTLDEALKNETHIVSYYAEDFAGRNTAFGEIFDPNALTAAHRTLPHNTLVRVTHLPTGKNITVRINDRGPYIDGRDMDLSRAAFGRLASLGNGILHDVTFERLGHSQEVSICPTPRYQRRLGRVLLTPGIPRTIERGKSITLTANRSFRMIQMRGPGMKPIRSRKWTQRNESIDISFERAGIYTFVLHEDSGRRRRFRTKVVRVCA